MTDVEWSSNSIASIQEQQCSWPLIPLGELCSISAGGTPKRSQPEYFGGGVPWVKIGDLTNDFVLQTEETLTDEGIANSSAKIFPKGTVLISIFATIGRTSILGIESATNQAIAGITPKNESQLLPRYLKYALDSKYAWLNRQARGVAQPNINSKILKSLLVLLPPIEEQRRIVDILKRADSIRRLRKQAIDTARQLIPALFIDMFGDPVANPNGWKIKQLKDVADIGSGVTKGRKLDGHQTVELPYLAVSNVQDGHLNLAKVKSIRVKSTEIEKYQVLPGDFLMTEGGDPDKLGRGAIWNGEIDVCLHQNHIFKVRCNRDILLPEYLRSLVGSHYGKGYFLRVAKQTTGIASINKTQLGNFPVILPHLELQNEFLAQLQKIQSIIDQQETACLKADASFQSLLYCCFFDVRD